MKIERDPLDDFTRSQRVKTPNHHIDMGFVNHRRIFTTFGAQFHAYYESRRKQADDHLTRLWNDHLLVTYALDLCRQRKVPTLGELLHAPRVGALFCSTEEFLPCPDVYDKERAVSTLNLSFESEWVVEVHYSTKHICADTGRMVLAKGHKESILAGVHEIRGNVLVVHPLVIGAPSFDHPRNEALGLDLMFHGWYWYEIHPEDIDEFNKIEGTPVPPLEDWQPVMSSIPETDVKAAIAKLLNDVTQKDWGGEINDHFASAVHLSGDRSTAAFLLKGPAKFEEMTPKHLGKNADQIFRLASSPAQVLVVQHCHSIGEAVRATLRAFAVSPANPRRFCLIDGRDTYRLLKAYDLLP